MDGLAMQFTQSIALMSTKKPLPSFIDMFRGSRDTARRSAVKKTKRKERPWRLQPLAA